MSWKKRVHEQKKTSSRAEISVFRMYSQAAQACTDLCLLEYHLGKVCGKNYLDDESLYIKNVGSKNILGLKKKDKKKCIFLT